MKAAPAVFFILFSILVPLTAFGAEADVMIVVNGNTEVNRESYNFIRKTFRFNGIDSTIAATMDPSKVKAGQYRTVVVLNTGTTSGLDPVLQKFISGYPDKKSLYLVNLHRSKGRSDVSVAPFTAASSEWGVDGVTSASTWTKGHGGSVEDMHREWVEDLIRFLERA